MKPTDKKQILDSLEDQELIMNENLDTLRIGLNNDLEDLLDDKKNECNDLIVDLYLIKSGIKLISIYPD